MKCNQSGNLFFLPNHIKRSTTYQININNYQDNKDRLEHYIRNPMGYTSGSTSPWSWASFGLTSGQRKLCALRKLYAS